MWGQEREKGSGYWSRTTFLPPWHQRACVRLGHTAPGPCLKAAQCPGELQRGLQGRSKTTVTSGLVPLGQSPSSAGSESAAESPRPWPWQNFTWRALSSHMETALCWCYPTTSMWLPMPVSRGALISVNVQIKKIALLQFPPQLNPHTHTHQLTCGNKNGLVLVHSVKTFFRSTYTSTVKELLRTWLKFCKPHMYMDTRKIINPGSRF